MKKLVIALGCFGLVLLGAWRFMLHTPANSTLADISGHWEGPAGGLWFDASASYFKLDIMHTFSYGDWKATSDSLCELQFYDMTELEAKTDRADLRGSAKLDRSTKKPTLLITMPDGSTGKFTYLSSPNDEMTTIEHNFNETKKGIENDQNQKQ